ncbi:hypothetical protein M0802_002725 [Mischocyttarus mexicanus]|nr:hypothetical protein M0802_002725 [Mischocyttarus mexicanus]
MWQDLDGLAGAGVHCSSHQGDQFGTAGVRPFLPAKKIPRVEDDKNNVPLRLEIFRTANRYSVLNAITGKGESSKVREKELKWQG